MRSEFSEKTKDRRYEYCGRQCERCGCDLPRPKAFFDHEWPDAEGGKNTFENCRCLCKFCHDLKTRKGDIPRMAHTKRAANKHEAHLLRMADKEAGMSVRPASKWRK